VWWWGLMVGGLSWGGGCWLSVGLSVGCRGYGLFGGWEVGGVGGFGGLVGGVLFDCGWDFWVCVVVLGFMCVGGWGLGGQEDWGWLGSGLGR